MRSFRSIQGLLFALMYSFGSIIAWMPAHEISFRTSQGITPKNVHKFERSHVMSNRHSIALPRLHASAMEVDTLIPEEERALNIPSPSPPRPPVDELGLSMEQKILNGVFLVATFGYALYTILTIDQGLTRGWTASEIAMRIPLDNWGAYESYLATKPVVTKTLINVIIYLLGDWLSQTAFKGKNVLDFDIVRTLRNGFIGLCFGPLVHEYYQFSDAILPPENGLFTRLEKIFMDQTIYLTVKCSIYISAVGLLSGDDWPTVQQTVKDKIQGIVFTAWKFWPLVHCITYGLIPARHRILWVNSVDLVWNAILATKAQRQSPEEMEQEALLKLEADSKDDVREEMVFPPKIVLDNQFVADQQDAVAELLSGGFSSGNNNTTDAVVA